MIKKLKRGQYYKTRGGWEAVCIWVNSNDLHKGGFCIHKPGQDLPKLLVSSQLVTPIFDEVGPIYHWGDGTAHTSWSLFEPPTYDTGHPADLIREIQKTLTIEKGSSKTKDSKAEAQSLL